MVRVSAVGLLLALTGCLRPDAPPQGAGDYGYHTVFAPKNAHVIGDAALTFAEYLAAMHRKLHPIYADTFLAGLDKLPPDNPLQDHSLNVTVEVVLEGATGKLVQGRVVRGSRSSAFDLAGLRALEHAAPFGPAPEAIRSFDGNVHLQWELRRDAMACSSLGAHPFLLRSP
jgi:hypothetical protein